VGKRRPIAHLPAGQFFALMTGAADAQSLPSDPHVLDEAGTHSFRARIFLEYSKKRSTLTGVFKTKLVAATE
jgi:hypothetical protein